MKKYYEAYEERYKTIHKMGYSWSGDESTPIVLDVLRRYGVKKSSRVLEIGCGEGRDASAVLKNGYRLLATDISEEAIAYCRAKFPEYKDSFAVLDCIGVKTDEVYDMIYAVAVLHMLVLDGDRAAFYRFIKDHLTEGGVALVCTMGDGTFEMQTGIEKAFTLQERNHFSGKVKVAGTTCRMVSFDTFRKEIGEAGLKIAEEGITSAMPDFDSLMYAVITK